MNTTRMRRGDLLGVQWIVFRQSLSEKSLHTISASVSEKKRLIPVGLQRAFTQGVLFVQVVRFVAMRRTAT